MKRPATTRPMYGAATFWLWRLHLGSRQGQFQGQSRLQHVRYLDRHAWNRIAVNPLKRELDTDAR